MNNVFRQTHIVCDKIYTVDNQNNLVLGARSIQVDFQMQSRV